MGTHTITKIGGSTTGSSGTAGFTDSFKIGITAAESNAGQTDAQTMAMRLAQSDTNATQLETLKLDFPAPDFGDNSGTPTDVRSFLLKFWLTGSAGTGVTNPSNADGSNNGTVATLVTATAGTNPIIMTSAMGANIPTMTVSTAVYRGYFKSVNVLVTSTGTVTIHSTTALFADLVIFSNAAANATVDYTVTPLSVDLIAAGINTIAKLQSVQLIHKTNDAVAGVTAHTLTVDAGSIELNGFF